MEQLDLRENRVGNEGARSLAASRHLAGLAILDLGYNLLTSEGALALGSSPHLKGLRWLILTGNRARRAALQQLCQRFVLVTA